MNHFNYYEHGKLNSQSDFAISEHFRISEFLNSYTADRLCISNIPNAEQVFNIVRLVREVLEPVRLIYGRPIAVSSGYRTPELNRAVGGVYSSRHLLGYAADLYCGDLDVLYRILLENRLKWNIEELIYNEQKQYIHLAL